jgi:hydroxymethylpyrimidine pyrophosphatase-like HAD family hydrolase
MTVVFDIDGTIAEETPTFERCLASPIEGAKEKMNILYDTGVTIIIYTARGWAEYKMTKRWLDDNGFKYHQLIMGKPIYDVWYDDRAQLPTWKKL